MNRTWYNNFKIQTLETGSSSVLGCNTVSLDKRFLTLRRIVVPSYMARNGPPTQ